MGYKWSHEYTEAMEILVDVFLNSEPAIRAFQRLECSKSQGEIYEQSCVEFLLQLNHLAMESYPHDFERLCKSSQKLSTRYIFDTLRKAFYDSKAAKNV
jgi:hypothetical protein